MRYEDISLHPEIALKKIYKFLHLQYHPKVQSFLETHTKTNSTGVSSTYKDSKTVPFHWKEDFAKNFSLVENIQSRCAKAMELWGYAPATDAKQLLELNPVLSPPWPEMNVESESENI